MTAKEYLSQLRRIDVRITQLIDEQTGLRSLMEMQAVRTDTERVQTSPGNTQEERIIKYIDLDWQITRTIDEYVNQKHKIISEIHQLNNSLFIQVLYLHYVPDGKHRTRRLEEIADLLTKTNGQAYSIDYINHVHGWALKEFEEKFLKHPGNNR